MYNNIPTEKGIKIIREELENREYKGIPTEFLVTLMKLVLEHSIFKYDQKLFVQLIGTATGTRMAPTFFNLFMGNRETFMLENCPNDLKNIYSAGKDLSMIFS